MTVRKKRSPNFSKEQRLQALLQLRANNGDLNKTALFLGVSKHTLRKWDKELGEEVNNDFIKRISTVAVIKKEEPDGDLSIEDREQRFMEDILTVKEYALARLQTLVQSEKKTDSLVNALKTLHELSPAQQEPPKEGKKTMSDFLQKVKEDYNIKD
mgnify:CR=1 FL=1